MTRDDDDDVSCSADASALAHGQTLEAVEAMSIASQAELAASDSMVLSSPACAVPLASIAGEAISRGETIHLTEGAYAHNSYSYRADALPGMPPPDVLLMVPLRAGMDLCATLRLALPRALPGHSAAGGAGAKPRCFTSGQIASLLGWPA